MFENKVQTNKFVWFVVMFALALAAEWAVQADISMGIKLMLIPVAVVIANVFGYAEAHIDRIITGDE